MMRNLRPTPARFSSPRRAGAASAGRALRRTFPDAHRVGHRRFEPIPEPPAPWRINLCEWLRLNDSSMMPNSKAAKKYRPTMTYAAEKFSNAVRELAIGTGGIRERLRNAYMHNVAHLEPERIPSDVRDRFIELRASMTWAEPTGTEGSIAATTQAISEDHAQRLATIIVDIALDLERKGE